MADDDRAAGEGAEDESGDPVAGQTEAEARFLEYLGRSSGGTDSDFASFCADHPHLADELRVLHERWRSIAPLLRSGVSADEFASSLQDILSSVAAEPPATYAPSIEPTLQLDADQAGVGNSPHEIVARLEENVRTEGRYLDADEIARGGMGIVYRVWDDDLRRDLAMKVVLPRPAGDGDDGSADAGGSSGGSSASGSGDSTSGPAVGTVGATGAAAEAALARFLEEAFVTAQLDHPGIVPVHELGVDSRGRVYFTMKLVKGRHLKRIFDLVHAGEEGWTLNRAVGVILRVCEAVAYAHSKGVLHRDIKPPNVMVGRYGETYLMDWGLARVVGSSIEADTLALEQLVEHPPEPEDEDDVHADSWLFSLDGAVLGTPMYMSPEQARGEVDRVDERSDIYSLGALLYHLLAGRMPYLEDDELPLPFTTLMRVRRGPPPPLAEVAPDAPPTLVAICERAMSRNLADRFESAADMASALEDYLEDISEAREEARRQARRAETINDFLTEMLTSGDPQRAQGRDITVREVLDTAARRIRTAFPDQPLDEAALRLTIGNIYRNLGLTMEAEPQLAGAVELMRAHLGRDAGQTLSACSDLATLYRQVHRLDEAEALIRDTLGRQRQHLGERHLDTLRSIAILAAIARMAGGRLDEAEELYRLSLEGRLDELGADHPDTLRAKNSLALTLQEKGKHEEALQLLREVRADCLRIHGPNHPQTLMAGIDLANMLQCTGAFDEAEPLYREALAGEEQVMGKEHYDISTARNNLGMLLLRKGEFDEAHELVAAAANAHRVRMGDGHINSITFAHNLALVQRERGLHAEAEALFAEVVSLAEEHISPDHQYVGRFRSNHAECLLSLGRREEARDEVERGLETLIATLGEQHEWTREAQQLLTQIDDAEGGRDADGAATSSE